MTDDSIALKSLLEKAPDADFLRDMIQFAAQRIMDLEVEALCGAGYGERSETRSNKRNGHRDRAWETRAGGLPPMKWSTHWVRFGPFLRRIERWQASERRQRISS